MGSNYVTGVVSNNSVEWLYDEVDYKDSTIHLTCEDCEYRNIEDGCDFCETEKEYLIGGWQKDDDGLFEPDTTSEFSAIVSTGSNVTQVVHSQYSQLVWPTSPCYPGQGDLDSPAKEDDKRALGLGDIMTMNLYSSSLIGGDDEYAKAIKPQVMAMCETGKVMPVLAYTLPPDMWGDNQPDGIQEVIA